jgi:hypothetical protein
MIEWVLQHNANIHQMEAVPLGDSDRRGVICVGLKVKAAHALRLGFSQQSRNPALIQPGGDNPAYQQAKKF